MIRLSENPLQPLEMLWKQGLLMTEKLGGQEALVSSLLLQNNAAVQAMIFTQIAGYKTQDIHTVAMKTQHSGS